ncbi:putative transcriptional regulatory protein, LysR family [Agrobacterium tumefaciens]|nr:putative transcriptional regulatory protein, LysR family [Agrobacterium tumefaciens]
MSKALPPLKPVLRIDFPPGERLGHGKIELMELIAETGSISAAGGRWTCPIVAHGCWWMR